MKKLLFFASAVALLASCSKDLTEDAFVEAPSFSGNNKIIASYEADAETRSHLNGAGKAAWDNGDALGVFAYNATTKTDDSNAMFGYGKDEEGVVAFTGDLMSVKGREFFVYYPWSYGQKIDNGVITLTIPDVQKYNHNATDGYGSFAPGIVPAVGYAKLADDIVKTPTTEFETELQSVVSYLSVPFKGIGKIFAIDLQIMIGTSAQKIAGTVNVDLYTPSIGTKNDGTEEELFFTINKAKTTKTKITLDCGDGVELNEDNAKKFVFAVAPNIDLSKATTIVFTVYDKDGVGTEIPYSMPAAAGRMTWRNTIIPFNNPFVWVESGKYLVQNPAQFVEYAYAATNGLTDVPEKHDMINEKDGEKTLKTALITKPLPFTDYTYAVAVAEDNEFYKFQKAVADWYTKNGGIESIGGAAKYAIEGRVEVEGATAPAAATITGLNVVGNGVFTATYAQGVAGIGNRVENIVLDNVTVTTDTEGAAYFLADNVWAFGENGKGIKNVTVTNSTLVAEDAETTAVVNIIQSTLYEDSGITAEVTGAEYFVNELDVYTDTAFEIKEVNFGAIIAQDGTKANEKNGAIITVPSAEVAKAVIAAISTDDTKYANAAGDGWFSVMAAGTSYWTGFSAEKNADNILTAEELAYVVENHINKGTKLTNDLNLMGDAGKMWPVTTKTTGYQVIGNSKTISNAKVTVKSAKDGYYSLFGTNVNISDLNVKDLTITLPSAYSKAKVAGIAYQTTASSPNTNITVDGLKFEIPAGTKFAEYNDQPGAVGGLFAFDTEDSQYSYAKDCSVANVTGIPADVAYGDIYGAVNVKLGEINSDNAIVIHGNTVANKPIGEVRCTAGVNIKTQQSTSFEFGYTSEQVPFSIFKFFSTEEAPIENGHNLWITWTDKTTTEKYVKADQVVNDFTLGEALEEAAKTATKENPVTVSVKAGKYSKDTLKDLKEGIILDCAEGTVFEGVTAANINGATIKGAAFESDKKYEAGTDRNDWGSAALTGGINGKFVNCTFKGYNAARGCYASGDIIEFEGCTFEATGFVSNDSNYGGYAFHIDSNSKPVKFTDCTFMGRVAFGEVVPVTMTECKFVGNGKYNTIEMWGSVTLKKCEFTKGNASVIDEIRVNTTKATTPIVFDTCTVNGVALVYTDVKGFNTNNCKIQ